MSDKPRDFAAHNCPPEDREQFFRDNAVACVEQRDDKIRRQAERIRKLEATVRVLRRKVVQLEICNRALRRAVRGHNVSRIE